MACRRKHCLVYKVLQGGIAHVAVLKTAVEHKAVVDALSAYGIVAYGQYAHIAPHGIVGHYLEIGKRGVDNLPESVCGFGAHFQ